MEYSKRLEDHIIEQTKQIEGLTTENLCLKEENADLLNYSEVCNFNFQRSRDEGKNLRDQMVSRDRRVNIIIHGLSEKEEIDDHILIEEFSKTLEIDSSFILAHHRLGHEKRGKIRPIMLIMTDMKHKAHVQSWKAQNRA